MLQTITYNDIPRVLAEMQQQMYELKISVEQLLSRRDNNNDNELVFGIFKKNELIALSDKRLWSLPSSPFKSERRARYAKDKGAPYKQAANEKRYYIKAKDLENWLTNNNA